MDDRGALEKRCGLAVTVGSNPTLSAFFSDPCVVISNQFRLRYMEAFCLNWSLNRDY